MIFQEGKWVEKFRFKHPVKVEYMEGFENGIEKNEKNKKKHNKLKLNMLIDMNGK